MIRNGWIDQVWEFLQEINEKKSQKTKETKGKKPHEPGKTVTHQMN